MPTEQELPLHDWGVLWQSRNSAIFAQREVLSLLPRGQELAGRRVQHQLVKSLLPQPHQPQIPRSQNRWNPRFLHHNRHASLQGHHDLRRNGRQASPPTPGKLRHRWGNQLIQGFWYVSQQGVQCLDHTHHRPQGRILRRPQVLICRRVWRRLHRQVRVDWRISSLLPRASALSPGDRRSDAIIP